jgi:hypothetical protein
MTAREQDRRGTSNRMSGVLWDTFTGSAPYRDILLRAMNPSFPLTLAWNVIAGNMPFGSGRQKGGP